MRKVTKKWTTKDGTKIRICDMTDSHLSNTIRLLETHAHYRYRYGLHSILYSTPMFGENAQMEQDRLFDHYVNDVTWKDYLPNYIYLCLLMEKERRLENEGD
jgi:hypothetical protein